MPENRFHLTLEALEASAHVAVEDQVEEQETQLPVPDLIPPDERYRLEVLRAGGVA